MPTRSKDGRGPNARIQTAVDAARATKKLDLTMKMLTCVTLDCCCRAGQRHTAVARVWLDSVWDALPRL